MWQSAPPKLRLGAALRRELIPLGSYQPAKPLAGAKSHSMAK